MSPRPPDASRLLAAVVLSACVGLVGGASAAWAIYRQLGPAERVVSSPITVNGGGGGQTTTYASLAAQAAPSLVRVVTHAVSTADLLAGTVTTAVGFIASGDGLVLTSVHALNGASRLQLVYSTGEVVDASVAGSDVAHGLAALRPSSVPSDVHASALAFADAQHRTPHPGDLVLAVSSRPFQGLAVTAGTVSAAGRTLAGPGSAAVPPDPCAAVLGVTTVDAVPDPSDDGAPLLNASGQVVGVVVSSPAGPSGLLALDGRSAAQLIDALGHGRTSTSLGFGAQSTLVDPATAGSAGSRPGALLVCVTTGGAAALAGLRAGDVVTAVGAIGIDADHPFDAVALGLSSGQHVTVTYIRAGQERQTAITVT